MESLKQTRVKDKRSRLTPQKLRNLLMRRSRLTLVSMLRRKRPRRVTRPRRLMILRQRLVQVRNLMPKRLRRVMTRRVTNQP